MANASKYHIPVTHSKTKEVRWMEVDTSVTCATRPTVTAAIWATLSMTQPESKAGYTFKKKLTCETSSSGDNTVAVYVTDPPVNDTGGGGGGNNTNDGNYTGAKAIGYQSDNLGFMNLGTTNVDLAKGSYGMVNQANAQPSSGQSIQVHMNSQKWKNDLSGSYAVGWPYVVQVWSVNAGLPEYNRRQSAGNMAQAVITTL